MAVVLVLSPACRWTKEGRRTRHLAQAEAHFEKKRFKEAVIEYKNVLQLDGRNPRAIRQLGIALYEAGAPGEASGYLQRAGDADPADLDVRERLAEVFLLRGARAKAREHAAFVLTKEPHNLQAVTVLGEAGETAPELDEVIARIEEDKSAFGEPDKVNGLLGSLYARKPDPARAEAAFTAAVKARPDSPDARLALARFYVATRRPDQARKILTEAIPEASETDEARLMLAELAFRDGKLDEASRRLESVLKVHPEDATALLLRARIHLAHHETTQAMQSATSVADAQPDLAPAHQVLALAHLESGNTALALTQAREALRLAPGFAEAAVLTAELELKSGSPRNAVEVMSAFVAENPAVPVAHALLGEAYLADGDPVRATEAFRARAALLPEDAHGEYLVGLGLRGQGKRTEARKRFEQALRLDPGFAEALAQLASMSLEDKQPGAAIERIRRQTMAAPKSAPLQYLLGRACQASRDLAGAQAAYLKALELQPDLVAAYVQLGRIDATSRQMDRAIQNFEKAAALSPADPVPQMLAAVSRQQKGDVAGAQARYEKIVAGHPSFAPASNNLAWLLEEEGDLPRALNLAQGARDAAPDEPHIADTLGWILYKQAAYPRALALFSESAAKLGDDPEVLYHLGLANHKLGRRAEAKEALTRALTSTAAFSGAEDAKAVLATLK